MERGPYRVPPARMAMFVAAFVVVAGIAGYLFGHQTRDEAPVADTTVLGEPATFGDLRMSLPEGWTVDQREVKAGSVLAGLDMVAILPDSPQPARMLAWLSKGDVNPQLLPLGRIDPASLQASKPPITVELPNGQTALRYDDLRLRRRQSPLRVYVAPTTKGVITLACPADYLPQPCDAVATTLSAVNADPLPVDPDATAADVIGGELDRLGTAAAGPVAQLATAKKGATVAAAATSLSQSYDRAAGSITEMDPPLGAATVSFDGLATRLGAVGNGYAGVAEAAKSGDRKAYDAASIRLNESRRELELAVSLMRRQGYDVDVTR